MPDMRLVALTLGLTFALAGALALAVLAVQRRGLAVGVDDAVFVKVGTGIGAGGAPLAGCGRNRIRLTFHPRETSSEIRLGSSCRSLTASSSAPPCG